MAYLPVPHLRREDPPRQFFDLLYVNPCDAPPTAKRCLLGACCGT
jgi:hypothetical protein